MRECGLNGTRALARPRNLGPIGSCELWQSGSSRSDVSPVSAVADLLPPSWFKEASSSPFLMALGVTSWGSSNQVFRRVAPVHLGVVDCSGRVPAESVGLGWSRFPRIWMEVGTCSRRGSKDESGTRQILGADVGSPKRKN